MKTRLTAFTVLWFLLLSVSGAFAAQYAPGEVMVLLKPQSSSVRLTAASVTNAAGMAYLSSVAKSAGASLLRTYPALSAARGGIFALMASGNRTTEELIAALQALPNVIAVSPNYKLKAAANPSDPYYQDGSMWGMSRIRAEEAWDISTGSSDVYVAVADTGVFHSHEDLVANIDQTYSRNFTNGTSPYSAMDLNFGDGQGHGTHVCGIVGAVGSNDLGVAGVTWHSKIIVLKVLNDDGTGYTSWTTDALNYVAELLTANPSMKIAALNMSLGGYASATPEEMKKSVDWEAYRALDQLNKTLIVVAAGNEGFEVGAPAPYTDFFDFQFLAGDYCYPAAYVGLDNMIVVGAMDSADAAPSYSNWSATNVHVVAPGVRIMSTASPTGDYDGDYRADNATYAYLSGTSMATPFVSGAAAVLASIYPDFSANQLKNAILMGANSSVNPAVTSNYGSGRISAHGLLDLKNAIDVATNYVPVTSITVDPNVLEVKIGETVQVNASVMPVNAAVQGVSWYSSNPTIADVSSSGVIEGKARGAVTITATALGGVNVKASVQVMVTGSSSTSGYVELPRSASVQRQLDAVNSQLASKKVLLDFGSLNNAMSNYVSTSGLSVMQQLNTATLAVKATPSHLSSGYAAIGKPAAVVKADVSDLSLANVALPLTVQYELSAQELSSLISSPDVGVVLSSPDEYAGDIFNSLAFIKERSDAAGTSFVPLLPKCVSAIDALNAGILALDGGDSLEITLSILVTDDAGSPSFDGNQLLVPDGMKNGSIDDPLWLVAVDDNATAPVPDPTPDPDPTPNPDPLPDPTYDGSDGGGGCSAVPLSSLLMFASGIVFLSRGKK